MEGETRTGRARSRRCLLMRNNRPRSSGAGRQVTAALPCFKREQPKVIFCLISWLSVIKDIKDSINQLLQYVSQFLFAS